MRYNWEKTGLLEGLSGRQKGLCVKAFEEALDYVMNYMHYGVDEKLTLKIERMSIDNLLSKKDVTVYDLMKLFHKREKMEIKLQLDFIIFPMIRRVISETNEPINLKDFLRHCRTHIHTFDSRKYSHNSDWEAEVCAYLAETFADGCMR